MNTLPLASTLEAFSRHEGVREFVSRLASGRYPVDCAELEGPAAAFLVAEAFRKLKAPFLVVVPTDQEAEDFAGDLELAGVPSEVFPWWRAAAYRPVSERSPVFGERSAALARALGFAEGRTARVVVASQRAAVAPVPPRAWFESMVRRVAVGEAIDAPALADALASWGYLRVPRVSLPGEFALRGEVLDIFMPGDEDALRLVFEFDTLEELRRFDPVSQSSRPERERTAVLRPVKELVWTPELVDGLERRLATLRGWDAEKAAAACAALRDFGEAKGEELLYPLAFDEPGSVFDYLPAGAVVFLHERERLAGQVESIEREYAGLYRKAMLDAPVPPPETQVLPFDERAEKTGRVVRTWALKDAEAETRLRFGVEPPRSFFGNVNYFKEELAGLIKAGYRVRICAETEIQAERIASMLKGFEVEVLAAGLSAGFQVPAIKLALVQENEIFGRRRRLPKSLKTARSRAIDTFVELAPGDYVVHQNYGIGRFLAVERVKVMGNERDYIKVEYAEDETVFVPIEQANLVQRYIGNEGEAPRLDRLGSKSWENRKSRVRKAVEDLAERLIRIYSRRAAAKGFAFAPDGEWQTAFEADFPYEETADQLTCIADVKADMESQKPMDRLICGDVGYGKTEIAMRAAFKAVMGGKQVAFLAPTTILAEQHYENMKERFRNYPVKVAMLSRFVEKKDQRAALEEAKEGRVDVLVGTHRVLQKDVAFKDLGLLVIDEEQRFGVKDKERLKEMRATIDCLTLTATPIPRTLHMSLLKIRDMSTLTTPPSNRHPIRTVVEEYDEKVIADGIRREMERGGQVFFLHNRIESLEEVRAMLQRVVPEALVETAHGQLDPTELEDIMHRFIHGGFHVLVSTTIIENGIDIPNVNTIVIDRADMYGISQLYQLRGRVGRSDREAYAYLFYPDRRALSEIAMKRLQIISDFTELGSGFKIAMKDLEVRGAGNLLGREQSGDIYAVGFDLYLRLLDEAVQRLSQEGWEPEEEPYLELEYAGYIPDDYIGQPAVKMEIYKKMAGIWTQDDIEALYRELEDRFGPVPEEVASLLALAEIRVLCKKLAIATLRERAGHVTVEFAKVAKVSVDRLLRLMRESAQKIRLDPRKPNVIVIETGKIGLREKSEFIREKLAALAG
ncbi:MAG: transcription-repair coupling factor [Spirochaetia bacterium]|nr:transcription-repair coupling factor [Spirochaetia bacterium]